MPTEPPTTIITAGNRDHIDELIEDIELKTGAIGPGRIDPDRAFSEAMRKFLEEMHRDRYVVRNWPPRPFWGPNQHWEVIS